MTPQERFEVMLNFKGFGNPNGKYKVCFIGIEEAMGFENESVSIIDNEIFKNELWNGQTRQLVANAGYDFDSLTTEDSLEIAKDYIQKIDFFGIHELLQDSGLRLFQKIGFDTLKNIPWRNQEITSNGI